MPLYAWVVPAFVPRGSPVDHTWVTSYDARHYNFKNISEVMHAGENFWYCWGDFRSFGRLISNRPGVIGAAGCLVGPNTKKSRGTIHWYGIDGVCHQLSNQVLYTTFTVSGRGPMCVRAARGYKLSSALFGTYGRRRAEWNQVRVRCGVAAPTVLGRRETVSLLSRRLAYALRMPASAERIQQFENIRRQLLFELDAVGFATREPNETEADRVVRMNEIINAFLREARDLLDNDIIFARVFGIPAGEEIFLIDPELFVFPEPTDQPERNSILGW